MENKFLRKYLEENSIFDIENRTAITGNPLITTLYKNTIIFHSDPKEFNIKYLKHSIGNQKHFYRNSINKNGKIQYKSCEEFLKILDKVERILKIKNINKNYENR